MENTSGEYRIWRWPDDYRGSCKLIMLSPRYDRSLAEAPDKGVQDWLLATTAATAIAARSLHRRRAGRQITAEKRANAIGGLLSVTNKRAHGRHCLIVLKGPPNSNGGCLSIHSDTTGNGTAPLKRTNARPCTHGGTGSGDAPIGRAALLWAY